MVPTISIQKISELKYPSSNIKNINISKIKYKTVIKLIISK